MELYLWMNPFPNSGRGCRPFEGRQAYHVYGYHNRARTGGVNITPHRFPSGPASPPHSRVQVKRVAKRSKGRAKSLWRSETIFSELASLFPRGIYRDAEEVIFARSQEKTQDDVDWIAEISGLWGLNLWKKLEDNRRVP